LSQQIEDAKTDLLAELLTSERGSLMALYAKGLARLAQTKPAGANVPAMLNDVLKYSDMDLEPSLEILIKYHAASDAFAEGIMNLEATPPKNLAAFLKAIIAKNKDANSLGAAHYTLGLFAKNRAKSGDEAALAIVVAKYAGANPDDDMDALGKRAAKALAGVKNLANLVVGKVAPEIRGKDLDGKPMKLSDFRGKVVLVDFWATWSGASVAQIPHNRELIATHKDKPFAIVGINADEVDEELFTALEKNKVNWRSFQNRPEDSEVEIADEWNVTALPTLYLLDAKGKIRKIWEAAPDKAELDAEIEKLLAEAGK
jgi:thiol-disulfide isomerase/thioredoxin